MTPLENLDEQIKDIILLNGGDIDVDDHPLIIREAGELGINRGELGRKIVKVFNSIEWSPYHKIEKKLEKHFLSGNISEAEAEEIIEGSADELQRPRVINYILASIKKRFFLPREKNSFEADSFKNRWMTDDAFAKYQREQIEVEWLGEKAHSLAELGEISYKKPADAKYYLRNANYLVPSITTLTKSVLAADVFSKIIENELTIDKRYLKIIYLLNPALPYRLNEQDFGNVTLLFKKTATDYNLFLAAADSYSNGFIDIWITQTDPVNAARLTGKYEFNNFLLLLYKVNTSHPFYLDSVRYDTPVQLLMKAETEAALWSKIAAAAENLQLLIWFEGVGRKELVDSYNTNKARVTGYVNYAEEDKALSLVASLVRLINPQLSDPKIQSDKKEIKLLSIEGNKQINQVIVFKMINTGFAKAVYYFDNPVDGIILNHYTFNFWSQHGREADAVILMVDASKLIRNKTYPLNLFINTEFERLTIPIAIKVVFPLKAYLFQVGKYAVFGGMFFALVRYVTGILVNNDSWFVPEQTYLPLNYFFYFIGMVIFIGGLTGAIFLIRKFEKI